jgi:cell division septation protein DedD/TolB-like protein
MRAPTIPWDRRVQVLVVAVAMGGAPLPAADAGGGLGQLDREEAKLGVLLFPNLTGTSRAVETIMPHIYEELDSRGVVYTDHATLRPTLRKHRIRFGGGIGAEDARYIQSEAGVTYLLLGSLDMFKTEDNPEVAVSVRLLEIERMSVFAGASAAATGEDFAGLFGVGRVTSVEELAGRVVARVFEHLDEVVAEIERNRERRGGRPKVAVVSLDDMSGTAHAGDIMSSILVSELVRAGFSVVEPGMVTEVFRKNRRVFRGGIDYPTLRRLREDLKIDFLLTGEVETFRAAVGAIEHARPSLAFGARLIAGRDGRLLMTFDESRNGDDSETVFRLGRFHSLGRLAQDSARKLVREVEKRAQREIEESHIQESTPEETVSQEPTEGTGEGTGEVAGMEGNGDVAVAPEEPTQVTSEGAGVVERAADSPVTPPGAAPRPHTGTQVSEPVSPVPARIGEDGFSAPSASAPGFAVHVSSWRREDSARREAAALEAVGYPAIWRRVLVPEKGSWYRVYAGPYGDRQTARNAAREIKSTGLSEYVQVHRLPAEEDEGG